MHPISVAIIAKNEEKQIEKCLASIKPYGFEIVVVDTGSCDRTKEIAGRYADQILDFTWCDDFSAARNYSLRAASNNWIFMIDCDEAVKSIDVDELNYFRKHLQDSVGSITRENFVTEQGVLTLNNTDYTERFFDRRLYRYTGIIHEQLTPIRGNDFPNYLLKTTITHTGYDMTPEQRRAKQIRNQTLLEKQLLQDSDNPYLYYQLGKACEITSDYVNACKYYGKGLEYDLDPELAYVQAMVVSYGNALLYTGQADTALGFEGIYEEFAGGADFVYLMGNIYKANKMYDQALIQYKKAIGMPQCRLHGANSFLPLYQSGTIFEITGHIPDAIACYQHCGNLAPAMERLAALQPKQE
ncbi:MAG: glycosyltransferase [Lachnospiraceae bacterium]|nr:glycosyltransferase [Lachnospiraceae bacterium]